MHALAVGVSRQSYVSPEPGLASNKREPVSVVLDGDGRIIDCTEGGERLFGFGRSELVNQHISMLFPLLSDVELLKDGHLNPFLHYLCNCGASFQGKTHDSLVFESELHFVELVRHGQMSTVRLIVLPFMEAE